MLQVMRINYLSTLCVLVPSLLSWFPSNRPSWTYAIIGNQYKPPEKLQQWNKKEEPLFPHLLKEFRKKNNQLFHYCKCSLLSKQVSSWTVEPGLPMAPLQQEMSTGLRNYHINTHVTCTWNNTYVTRMRMHIIHC